MIPATFDIAPAPWRGVTVARHRIPPDEFSDLSSPVYNIDVHLSRPYPLEWKRGSRYRRTSMTPGALCIGPAHDPMSLRWTDTIEILRVALTPAIVTETAANLNLRGAVEIPERHGDCDTQVAHIGNALWAEAAAGYPLGRVFGESLATALASCVLQRYSATPAAPPASGALSPRSLRAVREFIEEHLQSDISLDDMARIARLSPYHFARCFKATVGTSPHQYLIARRVERARQLLTDADLPLSQVAFRCGFADQSHLTRHMKRLLGTTPNLLTPRRNRRKILL
ncbi:MAG: AraC family transcriptional regulator [Armatimonadota bacterium]